VLNRSVFIFACVCGRQFQREEEDSFRCPECERLLVLEWRPDDGTVEADIQPSGGTRECEYAG
jgi:DNA-directed RNA polymerase subunit RPC12/RpoP